MRKKNIRRMQYKKDAGNLFNKEGFPHTYPSRDFHNPCITPKRERRREQSLKRGKKSQETDEREGGGRRNEQPKNNSEKKKKTQYRNPSKKSKKYENTMTGGKRILKPYCPRLRINKKGEREENALMGFQQRKGPRI